MAALVFATVHVPNAHAQAKKPAEEAADDATPKVPPLSETLKGMAKAEYQAGKVLFADGDYENAIVKFETAFKESKDPRLLWNIAVCQKFLRQYSKMLVSIRRYTKEAHELLGEEDRQQAEAIVKTVLQFISDFELTIDQPDAEVFVDDEKIATSPISEPLTLDVGKRKVRVVKEGYKPVEEQITVPGGGKVKLEVNLEKQLHRGRLIVEASEGDVISIDGKVVGQTRFDGSVRSGGHTLRVTAPEMQAYQSEVVLKDDEVRTVKVTLNPVPKDRTATILWVVGGVTLAAAAAVTSGFLFQPSTEPPVEGNISPGTVQLTLGAF